MRMDLFGANRSSPSNRGGLVVSIECVAGSSKAEEWNEKMVQTGDVLEEIRVGGESGLLKAPFKNGKTGLQKLLHLSYKKGETSVWFRALRRGSATVNSSPDSDTLLDLNACIVPQGGSSTNKRNYVLRSIKDPNYAVAFVDRPERECLDLQGSRSSRVACALNEARLQDGYVSYAWEKKMKESLQIPSSSSLLLSLLVLPKSTDASNSRYNSLEDTLARANAWLSCAQAAGVPIVFLSVQTEPLLTKISGQTASSTVNAGSIADLSKIANSSLYGFEDYHGVDIGVMKAVRLWYAPTAGEFSLEIALFEGDTRLGFSVDRTEEGFLYIFSVAEDDDDEDVSLPSTRSGLRDIYRKASSAGKFLVISRISNEKVLPWMVSPSGAIRCFDTLSIRDKLSLHRHALRPIQLHLLMWDMEASSSSPRSSSGSRRNHQLPIFVHSSMDRIMGDVLPLNDGANIGANIDGEASFRFADCQSLRL